MDALVGIRESGDRLSDAVCRENANRYEALPFAVALRQSCEDILHKGGAQHGMARFARIVVCDFPHHITARGNRREPIFFEDGDYYVYRELLQNRRARPVRKSGPIA